MGGAPPTEPGRRERLGELALFLACVVVVSLVAAGGVVLVAKVMLRLSQAARP